MPQKPYKEYEPGFDPLADAKEFLSRTSEPWQTPAPAPTHAPAPRQQAAPDDSFWGKVKKVANWHELPEDIGDQFAESVDPAATRGNDGWAKAKSFAAGAGKGFVDTLRSFGTPAGLATMGNPTGPAGRLLSGIGSTVFAGEGLETALDSEASGGDRVRGGAQALMGVLGVHGAAKTPAPVSRTGTKLNEGRFSKPYSEADAFNGEPVAPSAPVAPSRHPVDLFDTPGFKDAAAPVPSPDAPVSSALSPTATFLAHQDDFNGGSIPLYNIEGGPMHGSTVSAATLAENGIGVPHTPTFDPHIPDAGALKPHIKGNEFADILRGREKFAAKNPGISLPPGGRDALDQAGLEYNRTQSELKRLLGMPDADPAELARMKHGAREMGSRLRSAAKPPAPEFTNVEPPSTANEMAPTGRAGPDLTPEEYAVKRSGHFALPEDAAPLSDTHYRQGLERTERKLEGKFKTNNKQAIAEGWVDPHPLGRRKADRGLPSDTSSEAQRIKQRLAATTPESQSAITSELDALDAQTPPGEASMGSMGGNLAATIQEAIKTGDTQLIAKLLRVPVGAGLGYGFSDDDHKWEGTTAGGLLGAASTIPGAMRQFEQTASASMLASPLTLAKIALGNTGGGIIKAGQKAILEKNPAIIGKTLKEMFNPRLLGEAKTHFQNHATPDRLDSGSYARTGLRSIPGRAIGALDETYKGAFKRAGFTPEEAADVAITSDPKNKALKGILDWQRTNEEARVPFPFMKTMTGMADQGLVDPGKALGEMLNGRGTKAGAVIAGTAGLAGAGGYVAGDNLPAGAEPFAVAAAGPYAAPAAMGAALSHMPEGADPVDYLVNLARAGAKQLPLADVSDFDPRALLARLVPAPVKSAATYLDPTERETPGLFGKTFAKIPGLRETLPSKTKARGKTRRRYTNE